MARCVWRYNTTIMNVIAFSLGGTEASERVPNPGTGSPNRQPGDSEWDESVHGKWYGKGKPTLSPEEDQRRKEQVLAKLGFFAKKVGEAKLAAPPMSAEGQKKLDEARARTEAEEKEQEDFHNALDRLRNSLPE